MWLFRKPFYSGHNCPYRKPEVAVLCGCFTLRRIGVLYDGLAREIGCSSLWLFRRSRYRPGEPEACYPAIVAVLCGCFRRFEQPGELPHSLTVAQVAVLCGCFSMLPPPREDQGGHDRGVAALCGCFSIEADGLRYYLPRCLVLVAVLCGCFTCHILPPAPHPAPQPPLQFFVVVSLGLV